MTDLGFEAICFADAWGSLQKRVLLSASPNPVQFGRSRKPNQRNVSGYVGDRKEIQLVSSRQRKQDRNGVVLTGVGVDDYSSFRFV